MSVFNFLTDAYKAWDRCPLVDPGNAGTIQVRQSGPLHLRSAGVETRTLPIPGAKGTHLFIDMEADGGDITLTVTGGYDESGTTTFTFSDPGQFLYLVSTYDAAGNTYYWRKIADSTIDNLAGLTATAAELNATSDVSTRLVNTTATQITVTAAVNADRDLVLSSTHTVTVTLPQATGSGNRYFIKVGVTGTDGSKIIQVANTTDIIQGASIAANTQSTTIGFISSASSDTITLNNTTTGGLLGTRVEILDIAAGVFLAQVFNITTGNPATPWSASV